MRCFIRKIFERKINEKVHSQFVRFGKGNYEGRAALNLQKSGKIKLKGSFEYADDFVLLCCELGNIKFSGIVLSKEKLGLENEKKKSGIYSYNVGDLSCDDIKRIYEKSYFMLLDGKGEGVELKIKKKLPKPGKSGEGKVDVKFCQLESDLRHWQKIKEEFFWDVGDCKKVSVNHTYNIYDLMIPKDEKDFEQMRIKTKRKGKLIRKIEADKREQVREIEFEA